MRAAGSGQERPGMGQTPPSSEEATGTPGCPPEPPLPRGAAPPTPPEETLPEGAAVTPAEPP